MKQLIAHLEYCARSLHWSRPVPAVDLIELREDLEEAIRMARALLGSDAAVT